MQGRRLKYLDPISSPCEGIGELNIGHKKSTFNASDGELLSRTWVTGSRHSSLFSNALTVIQKTKQNKTKKKMSTKIFLF